MMDATTYSTRNAMRRRWVCRGPPSAMAPVPTVPMKNFFLLPLRSARLPRTGMSSASTSEATVSA